MDSPNSNSLSWEELIQRLLELFAYDEVNVEEVQQVLSSYQSDVNDWRKFAKFDKYKYTRNLVHEGNGKFNLMLLCWAEGNQSTIHDHANAHCFMKILDGGLREVRFHWPNDKVCPDGSLERKESTEAKANDVLYMSDELGLHRVENPSHSSKAVSLHLYSPPFTSCQIFDERTAKVNRCQMSFWSKYGKRHWPSPSKVSQNERKQKMEQVETTKTTDCCSRVNNNEKCIVETN